MQRMLGARAWNPQRVRTVLERSFQVTFVLSLTYPLWSLLFGPRLGMLIEIPLFVVMLLIALTCVVVIACGGLRHVDPTAFQLGQRLGRPRTVAGAELWTWAVFAVFGAWALVAQLAPGVTAPRASQPCSSAHTLQ